MIALNRKLPQECFDCPCLGTYSIDDDEGELHMIRQCHANNKLIYHAVFSNYKKDKIIQQKWITLPRPEWCPWIDVGNANLERTMTYPDDYDDEERWHHNMAGFGGDY